MKNKTPEAIATTYAGSRYRKMWQAAADGVYSQEHVPVVSAGSRFYNRDNWTARAFVAAMCKDLGNGTVVSGDFPEDYQIEAWCRAANQREVWSPNIVVSATAEELTRRDRDAIAGGCYHEKGHTAYSCRRTLNAWEMKSLLEDVWDLLPNWAPYAETLLSWGNLIEDIRIERLLQKDYAGTGGKLAPLQDFVLDMEAKGKAAAEHRGLPINEDLRVVHGAFRDLGLGYTTPLQQQILEDYENASPAGWALVTEGELKPFLDASIALGEMNRPGDDLAHLSLAMKVIATLVNKSDTPLDPPKGGDEGEGQEDPQCECCGAGVSKLRSRAVKGQPNKIAIVCTDCGHKIIIDKPEKGEAGGEGGGGGVSIEDPDADGSDESNEGDGNGPQGPVIRADDEEEDGDEGDAPETGEEDGEEDGSDTDSDATETEEEKESASQGENDTQDGENGTSDVPDATENGTDSDDSDSNDSNDDGDTDDSGSKDSKEAQDDGGKDGGKGAGAEQAPMTAEEVAASIVDALEDGEESGIKTHNEALEELVSEAHDKENETVQSGEKIWRPFAPDTDVVAPAQEGSRSAAVTLRNKARKGGAALKTQLRRKFLADRSTRRFHGVRRGKGLSERRLVDSAVEMASNVTPTRPDFSDLPKRDCSLAAAIIVDQSGSMCSRRKEAAIAMLALADGLDGVGAPVLCAGFRDIWNHNSTGIVPEGKEYGQFHRMGSIAIDIFKGWEEPLRNVLVRFPSVQATGGTPMADGVQYGLQALSTRTERHRILFVLTDGEPDHDHRGVMRRQIRLAREAGIEVVGIGIDSGCYGVRHTFDTGVAVENLEELPKAILTILDEIVFPSKAKRVKLDGKFSRSRSRRTA